jgi:hypothetical protein
MDAQQLGKQVGEHRTDAARLRRTALRFLAVAVIGLGAGVPLSVVFFTAPLNSASGGVLPGGLVAFGLICLCFGVPLLLKASRRKGERFDVHEHGLVHHVGGTDTAIRWSDIASVRPRGQELSGGGPHTLGIDFSCLLQLKDGRRIKFNTYTDRAPALAAHIDSQLQRVVRLTGF